jgi:hypothetical protein
VIEARNKLHIIITLLSRAFSASRLFYGRS